MINEKYYLKYIKYKKKYLELKGGSMPIDCRGKNMEMLSTSNPFGYPIFSQQNLYNHFGDCFSKGRFANFLEIARKNNVTILDMEKAGFTYHQIIVSEIDTEDNIYNEIWKNHKTLIKENKYFILRAISQGYLRLLAKDNSSPIFDDAKYMVEIGTEAFAHKADKEPFSDKLLILAFNMLLKIQSVKDSNGKTAVNYLDIFWKGLEKYNISPDDLKKLKADIFI